MPDPTSAWPTFAPVREVWVLPDDRSLVVVGYRGFETVLHLLEVEESADAVGLSAMNAFTLEVARQHVEASQAPLRLTVAFPWRTEVRLQAPVGQRAIVDRGWLRWQSMASGPREDLSAIASLKADLATAESPAQRRHIRRRIKAIRRNPYKAVTLPTTEPTPGGAQ